jgi:hypothetical protein
VRMHLQRLSALAGRRVTAGCVVKTTRIRIAKM